MTEKRSQPTLMDLFSRKKAKTGSSLGDNTAIPSTSTESQYAVESIQEETTTAKLDDNASEAKEQNEETMNMTPAPTIPLTQENARLGFSESKEPTGKVLMHDISEGVTAFREKRTLHDDQIAFLIENRKPDVSFKFPGKIYCAKRRASGTMTRHCQRQWVDDNNFIGYSVIEDGLYCLACSMFPMPAHHGSRSNVFITTPYRNWKDAVSDLKKHSALQYHRDSYNKMQGFLRTRSAPHTRVDQILSSKSRQVIKHNRKFLESIIRCLEHCGRQGIGLRGHRDDGNPLEEDDDLRGNMGNFKAVVTLVSRTDIDLREHLEKGRKNASYISKTTQNDLLQCVLEYIQQQIVDEVKKAEFMTFF